jgi:hypothetical protein
MNQQHTSSLLVSIVHLVAVKTFFYRVLISQEIIIVALYCPVPENAIPSELKS